MYQLEITPFGSYQKYSFTNHNTKNSFALVPARGALLLSSVFNGIEVLDGYTQPEELEQLPWRKSGVLSPFPNRLRDGSYAFEGQTLQFPLNHPHQNNAIHGFVSYEVFEVISTQVSEHQATITCRYENDGSNPSYPFEHSLETTFTLSDQKGLEVSFNFVNKSTKTIPVGLGWHPYFSISERIEDCSLEVEAMEQLLVDDRMIPTMASKPFDQFTTLTRISNTKLDDCFKINAEENLSRLNIKLQSPKGTLHYWQTTGKEKYNFVQLFTPPHGTCIAIEPMTCAPNAFNNGLGLVHLAPNANLGGSFGFQFN